MWYMSSSTNVQPKYRSCFGLFESLATRRTEAVIQWSLWALDNGRFAKGGVNPNWELDDWIASLHCYPEWVRKLAVFAVVADVPFDAHGTIEMFWEMRHHVLNAGYPVAFVTQNGMTPLDIPWSEIDAIFIGGDDDHKIGNEGAELIKAGNALGKWTHVGRVNSIKRLEQVWMADSADGTTLSIDPSLKNQARMALGVQGARAKKSNKTLLLPEVTSVL